MVSDCVLRKVQPRYASRVSHILLDPDPLQHNMEDGDTIDAHLQQVRDTLAMIRVDLDGIARSSAVAIRDSSFGGARSPYCMIQVIVLYLIRALLSTCSLRSTSCISHMRSLLHKCSIYPDAPAMIHVLYCTRPPPQYAWRTRRNLDPPQNPTDSAIGT